MKCVKIDIDECFKISEAVNSLFPDNYLYQLESFHINQLHFRAAYLLISGGEAIGTSVLYDNPGHIIDNQRVCTFGYFNCIDSVPASKILIDELKKEALQLGRSQLVGPLNGSTWESYRLRLSDLPDGFFLESATPAYYNRLLISNGFNVLRSYQSILIPSIKRFVQVKASSYQTSINEEIYFRPINQNNYEAELRAVYQLSSESFKSNFLYTPYPWEAFIEKYRMLESVANPEMTFVAEHKGEIVAYIFMIPDLLDYSSKRCVLKTFCVHPNYQSRGLSTYMTFHVLGQMVEKGFEQCIVAYVINEGVSQHMFEQQSEVFRDYALYTFPLFHE